MYSKYIYTHDVQMYTPYMMQMFQKQYFRWFWIKLILFAFVMTISDT